MQHVKEILIQQMRSFSEFTEGLENAAHAAEVDALTGLASRAMGKAYLTSQLEAERPTLAVLIDLDGLKQVNYRWGHAFGDQILKSVAGSLAESSKRFSLLCRWEGGKFLMVSHSIPDVPEDEAVMVSKRASRRYTVSADGSPLEVDIGVSAGVAVSKDGDSVRDLIARAESDLLRRRTLGQAWGRSP
jgi:diguanylate cyclase (GGDEF)-like protein